MHRRIFCFFCLVLVFGTVSCTKKESEKTVEPVVVSEIKKNDTNLNNSKSKEISREIRESLYFISSIEREALRLILKNPRFEKTTLFTVLSYIFEVKAGIKRSLPAGLDCNLYRIDDSMARSWVLYQTCQKNEIKLATVTQDLGASESFQSFRVEFNVKEWSKIIGFSAALSSKPISCQWIYKDKKVYSVDCSNWVFTTSTTAVSAEEIRLTTFQFNRESAQQLRLIGGIFVDLVERRKLEVLVPLQGKIKLIEKELEVKDDFAEYIKQENAKHGSKENQQKEDDYQKLIQVSSEDQSEGQNENQSQGENQNGQSQGPGEEVINQSQGGEPIEVQQNQDNGGVPKPNRGR